MLTGIYRINYFHFRHRGNAPTDYKQCTGRDGYTYFYCKFYMRNICSVVACRHNIGKNAEVEFGAFSFITSPLMKCSKSYFMSSHEYMDLTRA